MDNENKIHELTDDLQIMVSRKTLYHNEDSSAYDFDGFKISQSKFINYSTSIAGCLLLNKREFKPE